MNIDGNRMYIAYMDNPKFYDRCLSIWLSVDPMSDKYPSMSPYNYCANNPVMLVDPDGREAEWHPDGNGNLVADKGDNYETLCNYLSTIYGDIKNVNSGEMLRFKFQLAAFEGADITGLKLTSNNGTFDNLVGKYLNTMSQTNSSWGITNFPGDNCSPTTFNRVDKTMEFIFGQDILGKMSWNNQTYQNWQGQNGLFGTGVISSMGYGELVDKQSILDGGLTTGAVLRMTQKPGPGKTRVSWHAVIFLHYNYDSNGRIIGMTYWQQAGKLINSIDFNYNNNGKYSFSKGYKPSLGANFK